MPKKRDIAGLAFAWICLLGCGASAQQADGDFVYRTWTDDTGKFMVEAALIEVKEGKARLKKRNGTIVAAPVKRLSRADQQYLSDELKRRAGTTTPTTPATPIATSGSWPQFLGPTRDCHSSEKSLIKTFPADDPKVLWRVKLGTGFSGIAVAGGRGYTLFGEEDRENFFCFDVATGREVWKVDSDDDFAAGRSYGPRATPFIDGKHVYAVGASGMIWCLESAGGKKVWSFNLYDKFDMRRFEHVEGLSPSPLIDGGKLIVAGGTAVFALDKTNGKLIWKALEEKINHSSPRLATINGKKQLVVLTGENLVGLDPESGREIWRYEQRGANCATPVVGSGNQIFSGASYGFGSHLIKVNGGSAEQVYKNNVLATHHSTAVLHDGNLYGFHDRPGIFKCIDFASGEEKWVSRQPGKGKLIIADGQMIIITEYGTLVLAPVSPEGFEETAKAKLLTGTCYTAPTLVDGKLYLRSDKEMICVEMKK